jgi:hypothetical protein
MNKIPLPVIIALIVIAVILGVVATRHILSGGTPEPNYTMRPPPAALEHFRNSEMRAQSGQSGGMSEGSNVAAPAGNPAGH